MVSSWTDVELDGVARIIIKIYSDAFMEMSVLLLTVPLLSKMLFNAHCRTDWSYREFYFKLYELRYLGSQKRIPTA